MAIRGISPGLTPVRLRVSFVLHLTFVIASLSLNLTPSPPHPEQSRRHHRLSMTKNKRTDPVTLAFGRPDIGTYLTGTFALETETHDARTDCGLDTGDPLVSKRDIAGVPDHVSRQVHGRGHTHCVVGVQPTPSMLRNRH